MIDVPNLIKMIKYANDAGVSYIVEDDNMAFHLPYNDIVINADSESFTIDNLFSELNYMIQEKKKKEFVRNKWNDFYNSLNKDEKEFLKDIIKGIL